MEFEAESLFVASVDYKLRTGVLVEIITPRVY